MQPTRNNLPAHHVLTVTTLAGSTASVQRIPQPGSTTAYDQTELAASSTARFGPFADDRQYEIITLTGSPVSYTIDLSSPLGSSEVTALTNSTGGSTSDAVLADAANTAALTDNSGGAAADGTIGAVTAPTAITNNTGGDTSDAILGDGLTTTALTDGSGGAGPDGTIGAVTPPSTVADNSGGAAASEIAIISEGSTAGSADTGPVKNGFATLAARQAENRAAIIALTDAISEVAAKIATLTTDATTTNDNVAKLAVAQAADRTAIIALTDAVKELATKIGTLRTDAIASNDNVAKLSVAVNALRSSLVD